MAVRERQTGRISVAAGGSVEPRGVVGKGAQVIEGKKVRIVDAVLVLVHQDIDIAGAGRVPKSENFRATRNVLALSVTQLVEVSPINAFME